MLGDGGDIGTRDFKDLDPVLDCSIKIDVIGANTSSDTDFEVFGLSKFCVSEVFQ